MNDGIVSAQGAVLHTQAGEIKKLIVNIDYEVAEPINKWHGDNSLKFEHERTVWTSRP